MEKRFDAAKDELANDYFSTEQIKNYVFDFLKQLGFKKPACVKIENTNDLLENGKNSKVYSHLKKEYDLND